MQNRRIVITGIGLAAPNASNLEEFRHKLVNGISEIQEIDLRYIGKVPAGVCTFPETLYRKKKENKKGTRAGCLGVYCANEALKNGGLDMGTYDSSKIGVYIGLTEHGTVETENEVYNISQ
jgi:3-oxoacyl-[acyl-carrier-protein] synthase II